MQKAKNKASRMVTNSHTTPKPSKVHVHLIKQLATNFIHTHVTDALKYINNATCNSCNKRGNKCNTVRKSPLL